MSEKANQRIPLNELEMSGDFIRRHIGPDTHQLHEMLDELGIEQLDDIVEKVVPENILNTEPLTLTSTMSERSVRTYIRKVRARNKVFISMIGMGYYGTVMPPVIKRNVLENPGWYTAYTPYQAEISQGRLEAILNFQQMVMDLTGMEMANASMLDEATAAAEAMAMSKRLTKSKPKCNAFFVDEECHPQTIAVIKTRADSFGYELIIGDPYKDLSKHDVFGVIVQYPGTSGEVRDLEPVVTAAHEQSALVTVAADLLSLLLLKTPGEMDADIVIGNSQRFGVPMGYGGPHAAFFATREAYKRSVPGRIIGVSNDAIDQPAYRLALQTREQHIRRDKATSNICTSQALLAILASFYAVYYGPKELKMIAARVHRLTTILVAGLRQLGVEVMNETYFDTIKLHVPGRAKRIAARARESQINLRVYDADHLGISLDETIRRTEVRKVWKLFSTTKTAEKNVGLMDEEVAECIPDSLMRKTKFLTHPVFSSYHSESEIMRYMRRLARKDIALDRSMIPLGSCTMKLNAAAEMQAVSYREFNAMHPFAPLEQAQGYLQLFDELEDMLCDLTGFDAFSFQPNAGSQGEYAGLLVIKKYHQSQGQGHRNVCLIPASAHGTNPASAMMAGMKIVVVACDDAGNVDLDDLTAKATEHSEDLSCLMITYPSTHGVFEEAFVDICQLIHDNGGQVYMDGANFNALVGISRPGKIGADVSHLNLHKTFAIPHGGGGPGVGPIGVGSHLAAFLPDHPVVPGVNPAAGKHETIGAIAAAPWGSASILAISWAYIAMMGSHGLRRATLVAILSANYIKSRLAPHYPILYTGKNGMVAHECIIDLRPIKSACGITVDDIAKRLIDYGFHAPTMSFPVPDTMMIEPTESENKREIDRFIDAMISIRMEIQQVEDGKVDAKNNVLTNAPHPDVLLKKEWPFPYTMQEAFYPLPETHDDKYWPPVARIDNKAGDKNLVCSCPPMSSYE